MNVSSQWYLYLDSINEDDLMLPFFPHLNKINRKDQLALLTFKKDLKIISLK